MSHQHLAYDKVGVQKCKDGYLLSHQNLDQFLAKISIKTFVQR
jgi:hypothetical protein